MKSRAYTAVTIALVVFGAVGFVIIAVGQNADTIRGFLS